MTAPSDWDELWDLIKRAVPQAAELTRSEAAIETLADRLRDPTTRMQTLLVLQLVDTSVAEPLVAALLPLALSDRSALAVRHVFGRLPHRQAMTLIEAHFDGALAEAADGLDCRRYAELLLHLGADELIPRLTSRGRDLDDADSRELIAELEKSYVSRALRGHSGTLGQATIARRGRSSGAGKSFLHRGGPVRMIRLC